MKLAAFILVVMFMTSVAEAEVIDSAAGGFTSRSVHEIAAQPDQVWEALEDIGQWWNKDHTRSGDAGNLFLDAEAGEEFGEKIPGGGTVTHMDVVYADNGKILRMRGSLGPLQSMALVGVLSVEFAGSADGTTLTVTYAVGGYVDGGLMALAAPVDGVITDQFESLRLYVEK